MVLQSFSIIEPTVKLFVSMLPLVALLCFLLIAWEPASGWIDPDLMRNDFARISCFLETQWTS